jgi:hypothetical protein
MKSILLSFFVVLFCVLKVHAQYAPQVGLLGCDAVHKADPSIKAWASQCNIQRGYLDIAHPSSGFTSLGDSSLVLGTADGSVVSLGDSGVATVEFSQPIYNGLGTDFVVFENGFQNPSNPEEAFLELAFVEVSSDGHHFVRFPSYSFTPLDSQIKGSGDYMNARAIYQLAGKYIAQYGTPFDLEALRDSVGIDINHISHVRIIDVIGAINGQQSKDIMGHIINDPYPTSFPSGGFDLDAVAALHIYSSSLHEKGFDQYSFYPNPTSGILQLQLPELNAATSIILSDLNGTIVFEQAATLLRNELDIHDLSPGFYFIGLRQSSGIKWIGKCAKM